jgi:hypothetical protein
MHGGAPRSGAPKNSHNALTHGIYAQSLSDSEKEHWEKIDVAGIDDEIKIAKLQLLRARKYQHEIDAKLREDLEIDEYRSGEERGQAVELLIKKRVDTQAVIDRCLLRVGDLVGRRKALGGDSDNEQFDRFISAVNTPPVQPDGE